MSTMLGGNPNIPNEIAARSQSSSDTQAGTSEKIKRPANSFILYRCYASRLLKNQYPAKMLQADLSKVISEMWQNEPPQVRDEFERRAQEAKEQHAAMYPNYQYRPQRKVKKSKDGRASRRSRSRTSASTSTNNNHAEHEMANQSTEPFVPNASLFQLRSPDFGQLAPGAPVDVRPGYIPDYQRPAQVVSYGSQTHHNHAQVFLPSNQVQHGISQGYTAPRTQPFLIDSTNAMRSEAGPSSFSVASHQQSDGTAEPDLNDVLWMRWLSSLTDEHREEYLQRAAREGWLSGNNGQE